MRKTGTSVSYVLSEPQEVGEVPGPLLTSAAPQSMEGEAWMSWFLSFSCTGVKSQRDVLDSL